MHITSPGRSVGMGRLHSFWFGIVPLMQGLDRDLNGFWRTIEQMTDGFILATRWRRRWKTVTRSCGRRRDRFKRL